MSESSWSRWSESRIERVLVWFLRFALLVLLAAVLLRGDLLSAAALAAILGVHGGIYWLAAQRIQSPRWRCWLITLTDVLLSGLAFYLSGDLASQTIALGACVAAVVATRLGLWQALAVNMGVWLLFTWPSIFSWLWIGEQFSFMVLGNLIIVLALTWGMNYLATMETRQARAVHDATVRMRHLSTIYEVGRSITSTLDIDTVLDLGVRKVVEMLNAQAGSILLLDKTTDELVFRVVDGPVSESLLGRRMPRGEGIAGAAIQSGEGQIVNDVHLDPRWYAEPDLVTGFETRSILCVPLISRGRPVGALEAINKLDGSSFGSEDLELLSNFAIQAAVAVENAQLYESIDEALKVTTRDLATIQEIDHEFVSTLDHDRIINLVLERAIEASKANSGLIGILASGRQRFDTFFWQGTERELAPSLPAKGWPVERGVIGRVIRTGQAALVEDVSKDPDCEAVAKTTRAELAVPIRREGNVIGVLNLECDQPAAFTQAHLHFTEHLADHAGIAIENARLYQETQRRLHELSGLYQISQVIGSLTDVHQIYAQVSERIAYLMGVDMCGTLIYDEEKQALVGQPPFFGVPDAVADSYSLPVPEGAKAWQLWQERDVLILNDAERNPLIGELGLTELVQATGLRDTVFAPMVVGRRRVGAIQAINKADGSPFTEDDARLLCIFANQAAAVVDNAHLFETQQQQLRELGILFETSAAVSSSLELKEVLGTVARHMAYALEMSSCTISEWEPGNDMVTTLVAEATTADLAATLSTRDIGESYSLADYPATARVLRERRSHVVQVSDRDADPAERALLEEMGQESLLLMPLETRDRVVGLLELYESRHVREFSPDDIRLCRALANQAAIAIDNARLYEQTDERLNARIEELVALQRTMQELNATLDLDRILQVVLESAVRTTRTTHGNVVLMDTDTGKLVLRTAFGYSPQEESDIEALLWKSSEEGIILQVAQSGQARIVEDATLEPHTLCVRDDTRSALVVPVFYQDAVVGLISLLHTEEHAFEQDDLTFVQALAEQAAIAIGNAMRFEEQVKVNNMLRQRTEQMDGLLAVSHKLRTDVPLEDTLEEIAYAIQETVGFNIVLISVVEDQQSETPMLRRVAAAGLPLNVFEEAKRIRQPVQRYERILSEEYRQGLCYFFPFQRQDDWATELHTLIPMAETDEWQEGHWHPRDMLVAPMRGGGGRLLGHISVDEPRNGLRPAQRTLEILAIFANQAATAVENARLLEQTRRRVAELATVNEIGRAISSALDTGQLAELIYGQVSNLLDTRSFHIALYDRDAELIHLEFLVEEGQRYPPVALKLGQGLTSHIVRTGKPILLSRNVEAFLQVNDLVPARPLAKSWLGVPMIAEDRVIGAIAVQSFSRESAFDVEHLDLLTTIAGQAATAYQNVSLFQERQERIEQLNVLNEMAQALSSTLDLDQLLHVVYQQASRIVDTTNFFIALYDEEQEQIAFPFVVDPGKREDWGPQARGEGLAGTIIETGKPLLLPAGAAGMYREADREVQAGLCRSWLGVPMVAEDKVLGVIAVQDYEHEHVYSNEHLSLLSTVAAQAAVAVRNAQLYQQIVRFSSELEAMVEARTRDLAKALEELTVERDRVEALYQITSDLGATLELERVLQRALRLLADALGLEHGTILLLDQETGRLKLRATLDRDRPLKRKGQPTQWQPGVGLAGWILEHREPVLVADITQDPRWVHQPGKVHKMRSVVAAPLSLGGGDILGVLTLGHPNVGYFTKEHLQLVTAATGQIAIAVNNSDLYAFITDQADQLGAALQAQQEEAAKNRAILESIADGVLVLDHNGRVLLVNPAAEELLGFAGMALEGEHFRHMLGLGETTVHRDLAQGLYSELLKMLESRVDRASVREGRVRLEAGTRVLAVNITPLIVTAGSAPGLVAALRDISREAEVERLKNEFISTVSHELRTPMTSIKGYTDLLFLGMAGGLTDAQRNFLKIIKGNADRLTALVNDILDISRIETGRMRLKIESLHLGEIIHQVTVSFDEQYRDKNLALEWREPEHLPQVRADAARVTQVLSNLLANAWQYTPEGGRVTVSVHPIEGFLRVDVTDSGIGISPDDVNRIFDRFYRADHPVVQEAEGTGLGLSIVKMFIEMLGGEIWVESQLGLGSKFSFSLPLASTDLSEPVPDLLSTELAAGIGRRPKILVVEDDQDLALLLRRQLESEGYRVLLAGSGEDALWLARESQPQLITLDIMLPDMDGFGVLEELKENPLTSGIPVVIVSVLTDTEKGYALGAVDYVVKPFEESKLLQAVRTALLSLEEVKPHRVLVADDDPEVLAMLEDALSLHGYRVWTASNGQEALAQVNECEPDLILLDTRMPVMDGYDVIRELKGDESTRSIPVIVLTASSVDKEADRVQVLGAEVNQYLKKPLSIEMLIREIKKATVKESSK